MGYRAVTNYGAMIFFREQKRGEDFFGKNEAANTFSHGIDHQNFSLKIVSEAKELTLLGQKWFGCVHFEA